MKKYQFVRLLAVVLATVLLVSACTSGGNNSGVNTGSQQGGGSSDPAGTSGNDKPFAGKELNVLILKTAVWDELVTFKKEFEDATGMRVNFDSLPESAYFQKLQLSLSTGNGEYDVVFANNKILGQMISGKWVEPLEEYVSREAGGSWDYDDFIPMLARNLHVEGHTYGLPMASESSILYYNKKLFEEAGLTAPPKTLDELVEYAELLTKPEQEQYGIAMRATREGGANGYAWIMLWKLLGGSWFEDGRPPYEILDTDTAIRAADYWNTLLSNYAPPGISSYGVNEVVLNFQQGKIAMMIDATTLGSRVENPEESSVAGNVGYSVIEGIGESHTVGPLWGIFMPSSSREKDAAWELMKWLSSKEIMLKQVEQKSRPDVTRTSVINSDAFKNNYNQEWAAAMEQALNHADFEYTPLIAQGQQIRDLLAIALSKIISKQATVEDAMKEANAEVSKILAQ